MAAPAFWAYGVAVGLCVRCEELRRLSVLNLVRSVLNHLRDAAWRRDAVHLVGVELGVLAALTASLAFAGAPGPKDAAIAKVTRGEMSAEAFARLTAGMDPAMLALAGRFDSRTAAFAAQGAQLTEAADAGAPPEETGILRLQDMTPDEARIWNANNPTSTLPNPPAKPFHLKTSGMLDEARALDCMTAALYYEARWESVDGQRAVAQVVLNRLRHPAYPKTVCGVVFEGSNLKTGCQFSFTCDGSMRGQPIPAVWARARTLAEAALNGYVMRKVGTATHYHAVYVAPYWSPNLVKVSTIGAHIFYRWTGSWGRPPPSPAAMRAARSRACRSRPWTRSPARPAWTPPRWRRSAPKRRRWCWPPPTTPASRPTRTPPTPRRPSRSRPSMTSRPRPRLFRPRSSTGPADRKGPRRAWPCPRSRSDGLKVRGG